MNYQRYVCLLFENFFFTLTTTTTTKDFLQTNPEFVTLRNECDDSVKIHLFAVPTRGSISIGITLVCTDKKADKKQFDRFLIGKTLILVERRTRIQVQANTIDALLSTGYHNVYPGTYQLILG